MEKVRNSFFKKYKLEKTNVKSNLLTKSLLWMSLGLMVIIFVAWLSSNVASFQNFVQKFSFGTNWFLAWIINIVLIVSLFITLQNPKINITIPIILYCLFAFYEGMFITSALIFSGTVNVFKNLLIYMMIPASIFAIMGIIGYFNLIDFTKLIPFTLFASIGLIILSLLILLLNSWMLESIYLILASVVFIIWIGFDMQMIYRTDQTIYNFNISNKEITRISFLFGVKLFVDFINLLYLVIRMFRR